MKARLMYYIGLHPHDIPVRDVVAFHDYVEDIREEEQEMMKASVAAGVAEALDNLKIS